MLDIALGIIDKEGRYELSLFGKNVTDELFFSHHSDASGTIARVFSRVDRGSQAYYGVKAKFNF